MTPFKKLREDTQRGGFLMVEPLRSGYVPHVLLSAHGPCNLFLLICFDA